MKLKTLAITAFTVLAMTSTCLAQDINVSLNGNIVSFTNQKPVVVDGRTLIPLRGVFDEMGYDISWNGNTKTVTLTKGSDVIVINIGESCYYLNGTSHVIDVPAQIINGSTMLPLRAISDATGSEVLWDSDTKLATIIDADTAVTLPQNSTVITSSATELEYVQSYTAILKDFSPVMTSYSDLLTSISANGLTDASLNQVVTASENAYNKTIEAKNKLSALSVPTKYQSLNQSTIKYLQDVADVAQLVLKLSNESISTEEFETQFNKVGSQLMLDQAEYQRVFTEIIK